MKKLLLLILPILAFSFTACNPEDDDLGDNTFVIDGQTVKLNVGLMEYYGHEYSDNTVNIDLTLVNIMAESGVYFEMHVPKGNTKLVAGTYHYDEDSYEAFTFSYGSVPDEEGYDIEITNGTVIISVSGSTYKISVNCKLENGGTVKGTYKDSLLWVDETEYY